MRKEPKQGTQKGHILFWLRRHPLCSSEIYLTGITHRLAARIHDLRNDGWLIVSRRCENPAHKHEAKLVEYVLADEGRLF